MCEHAPGVLRIVAEYPNRRLECGISGPAGVALQGQADDSRNSGW